MARTTYTARFQLPDLLERGRANVIACEVYRAGAIVPPTGGTVTVYDRAGTVVTTAPVQVIGGIARHSLTAEATSALSLSEGWSISWALVISGVDYVFRNEAMLVRVAPSPAITEADLYRRASSLDPSGTASITALSDYADYIDEAWVIICQRLIGQGRRPWLVMSPSSLRDCHLALTLALVFEDLASRLNAAYLEHGRMYRAQYEVAWANLKMAYDEEDSGVADLGRKSGASVLWLGSASSVDRLRGFNAVKRF
jgi:hypothetical protein